MSTLIRFTVVASRNEDQVLMERYCVALSTYFGPWPHQYPSLVTMIEPSSYVRNVHINLSLEVVIVVLKEMGVAILNLFFLSLIVIKCDKGHIRED
jgi:hypothetical protein